MAQQVDKPLIYLSETQPFRKTHTVFDWLELVVERTERLSKRFKSLLVDVGALAFLIYEIIKLVSNLGSY